MLHRIQRHPPQHVRRRIAQPHRHVGVRALMHAERQHQHQQPETGSATNSWLIVLPARFHPNPSSLPALPDPYPNPGAPVRQSHAPWVSIAPRGALLLQYPQSPTFSRLLALSCAPHPPAPNPTAPTKPEWTTPLAPFRIAENLYYVGSKDLASYLIVTPAGRHPHQLESRQLATADSDEHREARLPHARRQDPPDQPRALRPRRRLGRAAAHDRRKVHGDGCRRARRRERRRRRTSPTPATAIRPRRSIACCTMAIRSASATPS